MTKVTMQRDPRDYEIRIWNSAKKGDERFVAQVVEWPGIMAHGDMCQRAADPVENLTAGGTTASDGKIKWFSNTAAQPADITYEFNGDTLVTHGPLGDAQWTRTGRASQQSSRSTEQDRSRGHTNPGDSIKREMFRRMFDRMHR